MFRVFFYAFLFLVFFAFCVVYECLDFFENCLKFECRFPAVFSACSRTLGPERGCLLQRVEVRCSPVVLAVSHAREASLPAFIGPHSRGMGRNEVALGLFVCSTVVFASVAWFME